MTEDNVRALTLDPATVQKQFFERIYGEQSGWVYIATKVPEMDGEWTKYFFRYPQQLDEMVVFINSSTATHEVYYSPAIFRSDCSKRSITKNDFGGTNVVWAEFDGSLPSEEIMATIPRPTIRLRSSTKGHEHWYWHLNFCETNVEALEKLTRALTYHLGADLSGWDFTQVLRPPKTIHHESGKLVELLEVHDDRVTLEAFLDIPDIPEYVWNVDFEEGDVPLPVRVLLKYKIPENDIDLLLRQEQPVGKRSSALARVGFVCAELGMTNAEIFSILKSCDTRWKKFSPRGEERQRKHLIGLIRHVRKKFPLNIKDDLEDSLPYFTFGEFSSMDIKVEWIVEGLIQKNGMPAIVGPPGVGKTHLTFQLAAHMVAGKPFLKWTFSRPMSLCIASMEMSPAETKEELVKIVNQFTEEEQKLIAKNLHIIPLGHRLSLNKLDAQDKLLRRLEQFHPEGIFFDSLGQSIDGSPNSDELINDVMDFAKRRINQHYDAFSWFIHHPRKGQIGNKNPDTMDDLYGSTYIAANATMIVSLNKKKPSDELIHFNYLKTRFAKRPDDFVIKRKDPCGFEIVSGETFATGVSGVSSAAFGGIDI